MKALFLTHEKLLTPGGGGNQICSREYRDVLVAAGFDRRFVIHGTDRSLGARMVLRTAANAGRTAKIVNR
jgi:hypothetical protein